jgi:cytochrome c-type biogenesis protein CcmH/NrfF
MAKAATVERVEAVIVWQQCHKHISPATDTDATIEDMVFSMWHFMAMMQQAPFSKKESTGKNRNIARGVFCVVCSKNSTC